VFPNVCAPADPANLGKLPERLSQTGLFIDGEVAPDALAYTPQFELWSDGARKRRWLRLPVGAAIDTDDPDDWELPDGTMVWKEFTRDGVRVETRVIAKLDGAWVAQAYVWNDTDDDALAAPAGHLDARGTDHDVPAAGECAGCHGGRRSFVLGVSAIQLAHDAAAGEVALDELEATGRIRTPLPRPLAIPGDATAQAALGYLHANCGHCHSAAAPPKPCLDPDNAYDLWLRVGTLTAVEATPAYTSTIDDAIRAGDPDGSQVVQNMSTRDLFARMPPLGTRLVDTEGLAAVRRWIEGLR
jgi:mono/diheme cytochrome c family protein